MASNNGLLEHNNHIVQEYEVPVLKLYKSPYKNAIIIRELNGAGNRNDLLNQLVTALKLNQQRANVCGFFFLKENNGAADDLSVVFLLRNVKKFYKLLKEFFNHQSNLLYIRIDGSLKEVVDLKSTNYSLMFLRDDNSCNNKLMAFNNAADLSLHDTWNLFGNMVVEKPNELIYIIITKNKIFINCESDVGATELLRALLLNFGTDYGLEECSERLVFLRSNSNLQNGDAFNDNLQIVVNV